MTLSLAEIAGAGFSVDDDSDALNDDFMHRLGMQNRFMPARLAIARSLAVPTRPDSAPASQHPRIIRGHALFGNGTGLPGWTALIVEHAQPDQLSSTKDFSDQVAGHWRRGLALLDEEWRRADGDLTEFVRRVADVAGLRQRGTVTIGETKEQPDASVRVPLGETALDISTEERASWMVNGPGGSPHSAIMGGVGSGKTRTAVAILKSIEEQTEIPFVVFDFKGDLGTEPGGYQLDRLLGAEVIEPPRIPVPLDVLALRSQDDITINQAAARFRDSFTLLKDGRLGARQREAFHEAATRALRRHRPCTLMHIRDSLEEVYSDREMKEDGASATMNKICRFPLFDPRDDPEEFFRKRWLFHLTPGMDENSRGIVVNLALDALDRYLNGLADAPTAEDGSRRLRLFCMIDEAHRILGTKLPGLSSLMRMSRSKGGAVMLVSQSPDDFSGESDDFLNEMGLVMSFATNAQAKAVRRILGASANLATLRTGECYAKLRGEPVVRKIRAWESLVT